MTFIDLKNQRFNRITVLEIAYRHNGKIHWKCKCNCGKYFVTAGRSLRNKHTQSCGCLQKDKTKEYYIRKGYKPISRISKLFYQYKYDAKRRELSFTLTREEFEEFISSECYYCGSKNKYNGIDRSDSSIGYFLENCRTACKRCNRAKFSYSEKEFLEWIKKVYTWKIDGMDNGQAQRP